MIDAERIKKLRERLPEYARAMKFEWGEFDIDDAHDIMGIRAVLDDYERLRAENVDLRFKLKMEAKFTDDRIRFHHEAVARAEKAEAELERARPLLEAAKNSPLKKYADDTVGWLQERPIIDAALAYKEKADDAQAK